MAIEDKDVIEEVVENVADAQHLGMSDADFLNAPVPDVEPVETTTEDDDNEQNESDDDSSDNDEGQAESEVPEEVSTEVTDNKNIQSDTQEEDTTKDKTKVEELKPEAVIDYKAAYEQLFTPFKANGREVKIDNVEDAISLMQMGANYNKKMAGLKPSLKILKLLENNGLLDESKLSFLIDLDKKDPAAINKLVTDSGINPMDIDTKSATDYKAKVHTIDEREIDLDTVLDEIQDTPTYTRTLNIVSQKWDTASKQHVAAQPQLLKIINSHIASGVYDVIAERVEKQRMFGTLDGVSDLDAYRKVGDELHANGGFNHLDSFQRNTSKAPVIVTPKPKQTDPALKDKRRAAGSSSVASDTTVSKEFNPLSMSDAEFSKLAESRYA